MHPEQPSTLNRIAELKRKIADAFKGVPAPAHDRIALHECDECTELRDAFAGKDWRSMDCEFLEAYCSRLSLLSPEALPYYLPAYLLCALDNFDPDNMVAEFTIYHLSPEERIAQSHAEWWREQLRFLTAEQMAVVGEFMQLVREHEGFRVYLGDVGPKHEQFREHWTNRWL